MTDGWFRFLVGAGGAAAFEILKYWDLQTKLTQAKFSKLLRSSAFWLPVIAMLIASGFVAWAYFDDRPASRTFDFVLAGAFARTLIREGMTTVAQRGQGRLGPSEQAATGDEIRLSDVFR